MDAKKKRGWHASIFFCFFCAWPAEQCSEGVFGRLSGDSNGAGQEASTIMYDHVKLL